MLSQAVAVALVPVAIGIAVTRHRLYDLDLAVCRALAGASLAVCLAGIYLTAFGILRALLADRTAVASALAAALTGLLCAAAGHAVPRVDRLFYGDRADRYAVLSAFSATLRERLDVAEVPQAVCDAIVSSLRLGSAELVLGSAARQRRARREARAPRCRRATAASAWARSRHAATGERVLDERDAELVAALADSPHRRSPRSAHRLAAAGAGIAGGRPRGGTTPRAATSTTASVRRWRCCCSWTRRATWSRTRWRPS